MVHLLTFFCVLGQGDGLPPFFPPLTDDVSFICFLIRVSFFPSPFLLHLPSPYVCLLLLFLVFVFFDLPAQTSPPPLPCPPPQSHPGLEHKAIPSLKLFFPDAPFPKGAMSAPYGHKNETSLHRSIPRWKFLASLLPRTPQDFLVVFSL